MIVVNRVRLRRRLRIKDDGTLFRGNKVLTIKYSCEYVNGRPIVPVTFVNPKTDLSIETQGLLRTRYDDVYVPRSILCIVVNDFHESTGYGYVDLNIFGDTYKKLKVYETDGDMVTLGRNIIDKYCITFAEPDQKVIVYKD